MKKSILKIVSYFILPFLICIALLVNVLSLFENRNTNLLEITLPVIESIIVLIVAGVYYLIYIKLDKSLTNIKDFLLMFVGILLIKVVYDSSLNFINEIYVTVPLLIIILLELILLSIVLLKNRKETNRFKSSK